MLSDAQLKFSNDITPEDIKVVEIYAQRIEANNCPALFSDDHLSDFLGFVDKG